MKKNKLLLPILAITSIVSPISISVSCGQKRATEEDILDAIFKPMDLTETNPIDDFKTEYHKLLSDEKKKDLIYGTFGMLNIPIGDEGTQKLDIRELNKNNEGGFKINITKCEVKEDNNEFYGTLLGYVSYVFEKEHNVTIQGTQLSFKANDYIMLTFDIFEAKLVVNTDFSISWQPKLSFSDLGLIKLRYNGSKDEAIEAITSFNTSSLKVKNSNNWVPKV